mmetsp:Transcript_64958/g.115469  ORF Transcript_64958/g.115469 Transcript_64958/m.115469 type:complete len:221 (-) Transcript_64958:1405-2067(-)
MERRHAFLARIFEILLVLLLKKLKMLKDGPVPCSSCYVKEGVPICCPEVLQATINERDVALRLQLTQHLKDLLPPIVSQQHVQVWHALMAVVGKSGCSEEVLKPFHEETKIPPDWITGDSEEHGMACRDRRFQRLPAFFLVCRQQRRNLANADLGASLHVHCHSHFLQDMPALLHFVLHQVTISLLLALHSLDHDCSGHTVNRCEGHLLLVLLVFLLILF